MGIATGTFQRLLDEHSKRPFLGNLLTLGRQDIFLSQTDIDFWFKYYGINPVRSTSFEMPEFIINDGYMSDHQFFDNFGVKIESLDASDYEDCDHVVDLNEPQCDPALKGQYDIILDTGTFEHVFNIPNAFKFCFEALKVGGRMIHMSPSSNYVDHGFYMLSPTLFNDFYTANDWDILQIKVIRHSKNHATDPYWVTDYSPDHFAHASFGGLDGYMYQTFVVVQKKATSTVNIVPQQRAYREFGWKSAEGSKGGWGASEIQRNIKERLSSRKDNIDALFSQKPDCYVAVFGAGTHSSILLEEWSKLDLPLPKCCFQTAQPAVSALAGVPIVKLDDMDKKRMPDLIVLSSHSAEKEMVKLVNEHFKGVPILRFWS